MFRIIIRVLFETTNSKEFVIKSKSYDFDETKFFFIKIPTTF